MKNTILNIMSVLFTAACATKGADMPEDIYGFKLKAINGEKVDLFYR